MSKCPQPSPPAGPTVEATDAHPRYRHLAVPLLCELGAGHAGIHEAGQLRWHDPPLLIVGGELWQPPAELEPEAAELEAVAGYLETCPDCGDSRRRQPGVPASRWWCSCELAADRAMGRLHAATRRA